MHCPDHLVQRKESMTIKMSWSCPKNSLCKQWKSWHLSSRCGMIKDVTLNTSKSCCYGFGYGMVQTACLFMIHVSRLVDSFGTGSNIFDPCPFSYCLYLVFPFLSRWSGLECSFGILCISVSLLWPFSKTFDSYLCRIVGLPL